MSEYYDPDNDALPRSPLLQAVKVKAAPSPSPPPFLIQHSLRLSAVGAATSPSPGHRKRRRPRTKPSQGDFVLIQTMDPNRPDIARLVGEHALASDSASASDDDDMEDCSATTDASPVESKSPSATAAPVPPALQTTAQKALDSRPPKCPPLFHRDSVVESDGHNPALTESPASVAEMNGIADGGMDVKPHSTLSQRPHVPLQAQGQRRHSSVTNGLHHSGSISASLSQLTIPPSRGSPSRTLPAIQSPEDAAASPGQGQRLPPFRHISEIAESAISEQGATPFGHRQSIASSTQSPTSNPRQLSITSALSPGSAFAPFNATSPNGDDLFLRSGQSHVALFSANSRRRQSQASDSSPYPATLPSASTTDSYHSPGGVSPGTLPTPTDQHRMSIDSTLANRTLPPPNGPNGPHIQHIPPHGASGYKCDHPGCTAAPFSTQYLLNSHANVHSQSRPHYCPVPGCSRAEGGRGFKRKNEMIRHGLVHQSPGYICPFCPDREHKYPRPDNLQRHVRVHHTDVSKDDPQLREVLAQRPEGGSRGRRRRLGS